jgi:hypothetical protein
MLEDLLYYIELRASYGHRYERYIREEESPGMVVDVNVDRSAVSRIGQKSLCLVLGREVALSTLLIDTSPDGFSVVIALKLRRSLLTQPQISMT